MATYADFCDHYGYTDTPETRSDYQRYKQEYALLCSFVGGAS